VFEHLKQLWMGIWQHLTPLPPFIGHDIGRKYILIMARLAKARRWSKR
jgi:hypothetical protein